MSGSEGTGNAGASRVEDKLGGLSLVGFVDNSSKRALFTGVAESVENDDGTVSVFENQHVDFWVIDASTPIFSRICWFGCRSGGFWATLRLFSHSDVVVGLWKANCPKQRRRSKIERTRRLTTGGMKGEQEKRGMARAATSLLGGPGCCK